MWTIVTAVGIAFVVIAALGPFILVALGMLLLKLRGLMAPS
jgi:hypothetical protein